MTEKYMLVGGMLDEDECEFGVWEEECADFESAREALEALRFVPHGYFARIDQWDDEIDGWQPCELERERVWTVREAPMTD